MANDLEAKYYFYKYMRLIAIILVTYISVLNMSPIVCGTYIAIKQTVSCSSDKCAEKKTSKQKSDTGSSCLSCCSVQNCNCSFVDASQFNFLVQINLNSQKAPFKKDKVLSDYLSDCWQPPEIA